jgi:hypothetical protein
MPNQMKHNKTLSLLMLFLTFGANFISLCPASDKHCNDVHLSFVSCSTQNCDRNAMEHSCQQEECKHRVCNDKTVLELNTITPHPQFVFHSPPVSCAVAYFISMTHSSTFIKSTCFSINDLLQLTTPLRI